MRKASTRMPEQGTQTPSPAPDLIPAKQSIENLHKDWNSERGHFTPARLVSVIARTQQKKKPQSRDCTLWRLGE